METENEIQADAQQRLRKALRGSVLWVFAVTLTAGIFLILSFNLVRGPEVSVELGEPSPEEVIAPQSITFNSEVLTEQARQQAAAAVQDQFTAVDLGVAREQISSVRDVFAFAEVVRADPSASRPTKIRYLLAIESVSLNEQVAEDLLQISSADFATVRDNVLQIVEDTMRQGVVDEQLGEARRRAALGAAFDLNQAQERIVTSVAPQFIVPNIFFDETATAEAQAEAMGDVQPVTQMVTRGERIIRVGDVIDEADIEMLERLGLRQRQFDWRRALSAFMLALISASVLTLYWGQFMQHRHQVGRDLTVVAIVVLLFVLGAKLLMSTRTDLVYLYPAAALSILLAVIFDVRWALVVTLVVAALVGFIAQDSLELAFYAVVGPTLALLTFRETQRINALFRAGVVAAVGNVATLLIFRLPTSVETTDLLTQILFGVLNGPIISASLGLAGIYIVGSVFRVTTSLQLQELSRLDHPLLQELLRRAPGTYHHSIMVANLAEQAAEQVKANSTLIRVGAFYHDVGKMNRPPFFSENQNGGNPHDHLDPFSSARIIISHVQDGVELARRYRLPNRVRDFIAEHHGTRVLRMFYNRAVDQAEPDDDIEIARFRYKGPRPRSRETGIVQLADSVEATSRALRPSTEAEIEKLVTTIIDDHLKEGQLDQSGLTLGDIRLIRESFIKTLKGRYHVRVKYPGNEDLKGAAAPEPSEQDQKSGLEYADDGTADAGETAAEAPSEGSDTVAEPLQAQESVDVPAVAARDLQDSSESELLVTEKDEAASPEDDDEELIEELDEPVRH
ncbi:MAG: HDIG domain-containing protein [Candidatus Promineifilaceae bacterium]|nr:HDIG domain-containing protein [Candidatus Promineifilaceae bacterium]